MRKISIIIVNYKTPELVCDCIRSVETHVTIPHEIIVVESAPEAPLTMPPITQETEFTHIPTKRRRGFGEANNLGAACAKGDYLWLLNSDTLVPDGRVNSLFSIMDQHSELGLVTPVLFNDRELHQRQPDFYAYFQRFRTLLTRTLRPNLEWNAVGLPEFIASEQITAAAMIIRAELFRKLGGFDERYFMYMEDDDLCYRAHQIGAGTAIATRAAIVHLQGRSIAHSRERKRYYYTSQRLFWETHYGWWPALLMRVLRIPLRLLKG